MVQLILLCLMCVQCDNVNLSIPFGGLELGGHEVLTFLSVLPNRWFYQKWSKSSVPMYEGKKNLVFVKKQLIFPCSCHKIAC